MTAECQQPITMQPNNQTNNLQQYQQHHHHHHLQQQHQHHHHHQQQLMQHQHQYNQDNQQQQMIVSSQFQNHNSGQQQVRHVHSSHQSRCSTVQVYAGGQVSMAPPTPPSDEVPTYQLVTVQRQTWSTPNSIGSEQASTDHQHQISNTNAGYYQQPAQPTTTIANYYYDIDDEFSDILSAPPTPEPMMLGGGHHHHHHNHHHHHHQQNHHLSNPNYHSQHQLANYPQQDQQHQQEEPGYQQTPDYRHYLPYSQPMSVASACGGPNAYELGSHYAMSPDSSSLSTTSSSPSDHSLYQSSTSLGTQQKQQLVQHQHQPQVKQEPEQHQEVSQQQHAQIRVQQPTAGLVVAAAPQVQQLQNHHRSSPIHLWEFLKELLQQVETSEAEGVIRWVDKAKGVFKIEDSVRVAKLWGKRKNKPKMNYDKLSRSIRQYYKKGIMKKTDRSQRLVYQFCSAYCH